MKSFRQFFQLESTGAIVLFLATLVALVLSNSPARIYYEGFFNSVLGWHWGSWRFTQTVLAWINEGLMTVFFLLVGLEIKREIFVGELNSLKKTLLPGIAAIGGMLVPAAIYFIFNRHDATALRGWAIPSATDIAFSLGVLALLGSRVPAAFKVFLTALAIFDDIGAIIIIAFFYASHLNGILLFIACGLVLVLFLLNRLKVEKISIYLAIGFLLWLCVLKSGIHATVVGVILAFAIPLTAKDPAYSPLKILEKRLHPWVIFGILPLFALANAGISFLEVSSQDIFNPITLGILLGLWVGKPIGILTASWIGVRLGWAALPDSIDWMGICGLGLLSGIGFTMSLFIGTLAFPWNGHYLIFVKLGVMMGSVLSALVGYVFLRNR